MILLKPPCEYIENALATRSEKSKICIKYCQKWLRAVLSAFYYFVIGFMYGSFPANTIDSFMILSGLILFSINSV